MNKKISILAMIALLSAINVEGKLKSSATQKVKKGMGKVKEKVSSVWTSRSRPGKAKIGGSGVRREGKGPRRIKEGKATPLFPVSPAWQQALREEARKEAAQERLKVYPPAPRVPQSRVERPRAYSAPPAASQRTTFTPTKEEVKKVQAELESYSPQPPAQKTSLSEQIKQQKEAFKKVVGPEEYKRMKEAARERTRVLEKQFALED